MSLINRYKRLVADSAGKGLLHRISTFLGLGYSTSALIEGAATFTVLMRSLSFDAGARPLVFTATRTRTFEVSSREEVEPCE